MVYNTQFISTKPLNLTPVCWKTTAEQFKTNISAPRVQVSCYATHASPADGKYSKQQCMSTSWLQFRINFKYEFSILSLFNATCACGIKRLCTEGICIMHGSSHMFRPSQHAFKLSKTKTQTTLCDHKVTTNASRPKQSYSDMQDQVKRLPVMPPSVLFLTNLQQTDYTVSQSQQNRMHNASA